MLGEHTDYERLRFFGCTTYYHVNEGKLDARAKNAIFLGYAAGVKGYRLWCMEDSKFIISRDVTFDENSMVASLKATVPDQPLRHYGQVNLVEYALSVEDDELVTFKEAIRDSNSESWLAAMEEEMESLRKNQRWEVVPLPVGKKAIGCKWVYKKKEDPFDLGGTRYKARLVAKGFAQRE
ncbi:Copia LTR rider [Abeliophyllum distichum]|uniref:Copia LTR rider n=1 Tax=Abeliophyllum distichum TaxID=126358 RepID=A0ABD1PCT8_9LAMI